MKMLTNILLILLVLIGTGLLTMGNKVGVIINLIALLCMIFLVKKRNLIKKGSWLTLPPINRQAGQSQWDSCYQRPIPFLLLMTCNENGLDIFTYLYKNCSMSSAWRPEHTFNIYLHSAFDRTFIPCLKTG